MAGVVSFLSPCVLPLVPGYISFLSGLSLEELSRTAQRKTVLRQAGLGSIFFVLGFSLVFISLGASASALGGLLSTHLGTLSKLAGILIMVFGFHTAGIIPIPWLYYEKRWQGSGLPPGLMGAFLMGLAFAFGWTPCIGPILASILALAATQETAARGMVLLFVYSLGLGIPFILTGFGLNFFMRFFARYRPFIRWGEIVAGLLLITVGGLVFANRLTWMIRFFPKFLYKFAL